MLAERGIDVSYETVRRWALKFGAIIARKLRRGRPRPSSSQLARNDRAKLQSPAADRLVGHIDATLSEHILDVAVAQSEAEIEPDRCWMTMLGKRWRRYESLSISGS